MSGAQPGHDVMQAAVLVEKSTHGREGIEGDESHLREYQDPAWSHSTFMGQRVAPVAIAVVIF
ncbi:hypothetical protein PM082_008846 [Marasmius tenuissimus]|nr:hypothetical protein PM082_008846 [Marasmius tenuissimus]